jgi:hypothetical protein
LKKRWSHRICLAAACVLTATGITLRGQQSNTLYLMHPVPQSNLLNPAVQATCRLYVGIPVLASAYLSFSNTAFTYNNLAGSDTWNLEGTASQMHRRDYYGAEAALQLISLGYRHRMTYFTFDVAEKGRFYSVVPGDLVSMAVFGNGPSVGESVKFRSLRPGATYKREYSFGISRVLNRNLTVGARAKIIFGKASLSTGPSDLRFRTEKNSFNLLLDGDYTIRASFPLTITQDAEGNITEVTVEDLNYAELLLNRRNPGMGIDLGMIYRLDGRTTLSASLLDMGFIRWRTDLNSVRTAGTFDFRGVDAGTDVVSFDYLEQMIDSLLNSFSEEVYHQPYTSYPPVQLFLAGSYRLREHMTLGLVNRNVIFRSKMHSSFTFSLQTELGNRFLAAASWSYLNNSLAILGAGIAYTGRGVQFHVVSDNVLGFFSPFDTRAISLRIGANLMLGCPRSRKEERENSAYGNLPDPEFCGTGEPPGKVTRKMKRAARRINRK